MKPVKQLLLAIPALAITMEALPWGAVLRFGNPDGDPIRRTYSFFSLTPYAYANFGPFLTAILTCIIVFLALALLLKPKKGCLTAISVLSAVGVVTSLMPLMYGFSYLTVISVCITLLLLATCVLTFFIGKSNKA